MVGGTVCACLQHLWNMGIRSRLGLDLAQHLYKGKVYHIYSGKCVSFLCKSYSSLHCVVHKLILKTTSWVYVFCSYISISYN